MSIEPLPQLNKAIAHIDTLWKERQAQMEQDLNVLHLMRLSYRYGQVWGSRVPARVEWIVEGNIEEMRDAE